MTKRGTGAIGARIPRFCHEPQIVNAAQNANGRDARAHIATHASFSYSKARSRRPSFSLINAIAHAPELRVFALVVARFKTSAHWLTRFVAIRCTGDGRI